MLHHGGRLNAVAKKYAIAAEHWIDLSTGINPEHWPIPALPDHCFTRLPENDDGLMQAAHQYYKTDACLAVAGSQAAIQMLPRCRQQSSVAVPDIGYAEHAYQWRLAGHDVVFYRGDNIDAVIHQVDVLVIINPNNPSAVTYDRQKLLHYHQILQQRQGWLIVDEAFSDCDEKNSLVRQAHKPGLIVLRSFGKFFGLAGVRSGFIFAEKLLLDRLNLLLGPWTLSGASRYITKKALLDSQWQQQAKNNLQASSEKLHRLIQHHSGRQPAGTWLFKTVMHPQAETIFTLFAEQAVFIRLLDNKQGVRFGLPRPDQWPTVDAIFGQVFQQLALILVDDKQKQA
ncbi:MAG: threonine-phosphate decarboxylase CobD [Gammaproteobacteria bacterium]|nr:threonine-phosphate decarboxylase CobD [Gammaproteobacteria bacterium]